MHGELRKARSTLDPALIYDIDGWELKSGDACEKGSQLRPHVVWFGEPVPAIEEAVGIIQDADILVIIGTSLNVYPAAGLVNYAPPSIPIYLIDPNEVYTPSETITYIREPAAKGVRSLIQILVP